jgi:hypothetical protein
VKIVINVGERASTADERDRKYHRLASSREVKLLEKMVNFKYGHNKETTFTSKYAKEQLEKSLKVS